MSILRKNIWALLLVDCLVIILSIVGSYLLRFDFSIPQSMFQNIYYLLGVLLFSKISVNIVFKVYSGLWRYTSVRDLLNIIKASSAGTILSAALSLMVLGFVAVQVACCQARGLSCSCPSQTDFCDPSHLGAQLFPRIREPAIWYFIWSAPPHSGRPFSTFRAPAARRMLCASRHTILLRSWVRPVGVCVLLGSELTSLISQLFWDQV